MFKNYLIASVRSLLKNKFNTIVSVSSLAFGIACCIASYVFIHHEYSFDSFHENSDKVYRIVNEKVTSSAIQYNGELSFPFSERLKEDFTDFKVTHVYSRNYLSIQKKGDLGNQIEVNQAAYTDANFLEIFKYKLIAGNRDKLLNDPDKIVLTSTLAKKCFEINDDVDFLNLIGEVINVNGKYFRISGIVEDIPYNTNIYFDALLPMSNFKTAYPQYFKEWNKYWSGNYVFMEVDEGVTPQTVENQLENFKEKYLDEKNADMNTFLLQPLSAIHTSSKYGGTMYSTPSIMIVALILMSVIVLLIAIINFVNISTAQSIKRAKEIGVRKVLGSTKAQLVTQFLLETFLITVFACLIGLGIAKYFISGFNEFVSSVIDLKLEIDTTVIYFLIILSLLVTLVSGYLPARLMSDFKIIAVLKQSVNSGSRKKFSLRKILVITQFNASQVLIAVTFIVSLQMEYFYKQDLGYNKENKIIVDLPVNDGQTKLLKADLKKIPEIKNLSFCSGPPTSRNRSHSSFYEKARGNNQTYKIENKFVDDNYLNVYEIPLIAGRNLLPGDATFTTINTVDQFNILVNEATIKRLNYSSAGEALGKVLIIDNEDIGVIVGVVEDFNNSSLQKDVSPCLLAFAENRFNQANIATSSSNTIDALEETKEVWAKVFPNEVFNFYFMDEYLSAFYLLEDMMYKAFKLFAYLSIFIGCIGLYGLVNYLTLQKQKEVGIRKTLGASTGNIMFSFYKEFTVLNLIAFLAAGPISYFISRAWLDTFANRIDISFVYLFLALVITIGLTWLIISYHTYKSANTNPVNVLKTE